MALGGTKGQAVRSKRRDYSGVYAIVNFPEKRFYVGSSVRMFDRLGTHGRHLIEGRHHSRPLQQDWNRLGSESFEAIFLEDAVDQNYLAERENFWIDALGSLGHYNACRAHNRRDNRPYHLKFLQTEIGTIWVGQGVWSGGKQEEIDSIFQIYGRANVRFVGKSEIVDVRTITPIEHE